jgi:hypothetical protein
VPASKDRKLRERVAGIEPLAGEPLGEIGYVFGRSRSR